MTQATRYARVLAKIGAERSTLLPESKFKTLSESKSLNELAAQLRDTTYQGQIGKVPLPLSSRKLERAINENFIEACIKVVENSPKEASEYLSSYLLKFEVENIKSLIKAVNVKLSPELKNGMIYFSVEEYFRRRSVMEEAAKALTAKQVAVALKGTMYSLALSMGLQSYEESGTTARFDIMLDKVFYENLCSAYDDLPKGQRPFAKFYAGAEIDGFTMLTLLRGKILNYDSNWLRLAVPDDNVVLSPKTVETLVSAADYESAIKIVLESRYARFFVKVDTPEETVANAEKSLMKAVLEHAKRNRISESFNVGAALAFVEQKRAEARNLVALSAGVEAGLGADFILSKLLF